VSESGTAMRFVCAYLSVTTQRSVRLFGTGRQHERPIAPLVEARSSCLRTRSPAQKLARVRAAIALRKLPHTGVENDWREPDSGWTASLNSEPRSVRLPSVRHSLKRPLTSGSRNRAGGTEVEVDS